MKPDQALFDEIFLSKVRQAERMTPEERLLASLRLSDASLEFVRAGVKSQFPTATDEEIERHVAKRIKLAKEVRNWR